MSGTAHLQGMSTQTSSKPRVQRGVREGGQWTTEQRSEPLVSLGDETARAARLAQLEAGGYIAAIPVAAQQTPLRPGAVGSWWDEHHVVAEYRAGHGGYPQMPDDEVDNDKTGRGLRGGRRVRRMLYQGQDISVRMPAVAAIRRYAASQESRTFDVPVTAQVTGPDGQTRDVSTWVRVTRGGNGHWDAVTVGMDGPNGKQLAEAVSATLEARRVRSALRDVEALNARRVERASKQGGELIEKKSQWIARVGYDEHNGVMATELTSGAIYGHQVSRTRFEIVANSHAPGAQFNKVIKGAQRAPVDTCQDCGRFYSQSKGHQCPIEPGPQSLEALEPNVNAHERTQKIAEGLRAKQERAQRAALRAAAVAERRAQAQAQPPRATDVDDWFERELDKRQTRLGSFGGPGHTRPLLKHVAPFTTSAHVPERYRENQAGGFTYATHNGQNQMMSFAGVSGNSALALGKAMTPRQLKVRQCDGPTAREVLLSAYRNPDNVEACGYMVSPSREDERFVVGGVHLYDKDVSNAQEAVERLQERYQIAGEVPPARVDLLDTPWRGPGTKAWRVVW